MKTAMLLASLATLAATAMPQRATAEDFQHSRLVPPAYIDATTVEKLLPRCFTRCER